MKIIKKTLSQQIQIHVLYFLIVSSILLVILFLLFLNHTNKNATQGYNISIFSDKRAELAKDNEKLSMELADLQSLENLQSEELISNLVIVNSEEVAYIKKESSLAKK